MSLILLLAAVALIDFGSGDDLAFQHLYYLPLVLAGFAFTAQHALLFSLVASCLAMQLTPPHDFPTTFGSPVYTTLARTLAFALTSTTTSLLAAAYRQQVGRLLALHEITASINQAVGVSETLEVIARHSSTLTQAHLSYVFLRERDTDMLSIGAATGDRSASHKDFSVSMRNSPLGALLQSHEPKRFNEVSKLPAAVPPAPLPATARALMTAPLIVRSETIGLLVVASSGRKRFNRGELEGLRLLAEAAAIAIDEARMYERTEQLAITDELTGLNNQRYFRQHFELELGRAQRRSGILSLVLFDLDHFKRINDTYGHLTGDAVLRAVARVARTMVRRTDLLARIGGEEFGILLPESNRTDALGVADKLRLAVAESEFETADGRPLRLTLSAGVASYPFDGTEMADIFEASDKALYRAKSSGRNRVHPEVEPELAAAR